MFACTIAGGMAMGMPDVCKTPPFSEPIPYPNTAELPQGEPAAETVLVAGSPALTVNSSVPMSMGDNAGVEGGVASSTVMEEMKFTEGSTKVFIEGAAAVRLSSPTTHNNENAVGLVLEPSQEKVMIMS